MAWPFSTPSGASRIEPTFAPRAASPENPSTSLSDPASWLTDLFGGGPTFAGPSVTETSAMRSSTVFRCVSLKAGLIASLPLVVYQREPTGRKEAVKHRLYPLLADEPSDLMSAFIWKELIAANLMLSGNHFSIIEQDNAARTIGLLPVLPHQVTVARVKGRNRYTVRFNDGQEILDQSEVVHVPGVGFDGLRGLSPIAWAGRQPIGLGLAIEESVGRIYSNGMMPASVIEVPKGLSDAALKRLKAEVAALHTGVANTGRALYLDQGGKMTPLQISPLDMQTLESRRFQVADICRLFGIPPHMLGETDKTTCLPADTLISTPRGPKRICEMRPGDHVWSLDWSGARFVRSTVARSERTGTDPILTIRTMGRMLRANSKHRVLVRRKFSAPQAGIGGYRKVRWDNIWVAAGELVVGDYIVAAAALPSNSTRITPTGRALSAGFMEFAGLMIGDGNVIGTSSAFITVARAENCRYMDHYRRVMRDEFVKCEFAFGPASEREVAPIAIREGCRQTRFNSVLASEILRGLGLAGTAKTKRVPPWIFDLAPDLQLAFLRGYLDSDGACDRRGWITYSSCNKALLEDVRHLCMGLGVTVGTVRTYFQDSECIINGRRFHRGEMHQLFLCDVASNRRIGSNDPIYQDRLASARTPSHRVNRYSPKFQGRGGSPASRPGTDFAIEGAALHRIVSIDVGASEDVFDLEVEGTHSFIADGIVVHNSWGAGIEQQTIGFLLFSIDPDLCRIEAELNRKLLKHPFYCQFDRDALRAMDSKTMAEIFASGVQNARYTPNEVRRQTNLPDMPGGDQLFIQGATIPLSDAGKQAAPDPASDPAPLPVNP